MVLFTCHQRVESSPSSTWNPVLLVKWHLSGQVLVCNKQTNTVYTVWSNWEQGMPDCSIASIPFEGSAPSDLITLTEISLLKGFPSLLISVWSLMLKVIIQCNISHTYSHFLFVAVFYAYFCFPHFSCSVFFMKHFIWSLVPLCSYHVSYTSFEKCSGICS